MRANSPSWAGTRLKEPPNRVPVHASIKKLATKTFHQKLGGNLKPLGLRQAVRTHLTK